jgi:beta-lactamase class A
MIAPRRPLFAGILATCALAACGDSTRPPVVAPTETTPPTTTPPTSTAAGTVDTQPAVAADPIPLPAGVPDTAAGHQLAWVLDMIVNQKGVVDRAAIEAHFHTSFLAQVPADTVALIFGQIHKEAGALTLGAVTEKAGKLSVKADSRAGKLVIILGVHASDQKIETLLFQPDVGDAPKPTSWAELDKALAAAAPKADVFVARVEKGACKKVHAVNAKAPLAIGSTSKLYVLLSVVDQIRAGKLAWETEVEVKDEWKSLPSGVTQDDPAGTKLTVKTLADRMISISDNTATDHLVYTAGRKNVEAAVKATKHAKPALNVPFITTRELFLLKLGLPADEIAAYKKLGAEKRRALLDGKYATVKPTLDGIEAWKDARDIDTLEWFASGEDLCKVMATLASRAEKDKDKAGPLLDVLSLNPGLPIDKAKWPFIGFKGGSEPGVLNGTFLLRRDDGVWFVVTAGFNGPTEIDQAKAFAVLGGAIDLAATAPAK